MHLLPSVPFAAPFLFFPFQSEDEDTPHVLTASSPVLVPRQSAQAAVPPAEETRKTRRNSRAPTASIDLLACLTTALLARAQADNAVSVNGLSSIPRPTDSALSDLEFG
ncbi:hypothetical protein B0H13DRAFT_2376250 [Mycena leptocephala]|nr:hypothetical protein B0H13DRAFT_2376250 [Mycena leptocephala]